MNREFSKILYEGSWFVHGDFCFFDINVFVFGGQKCPSMSHKLSKKFFGGCATRWGKISINNPLSGVGLAHENLNSL